MPIPWQALSSFVGDTVLEFVEDGVEKSAHGTNNSFNGFPDRRRCGTT